MDGFTVNAKIWLIHNAAGKWLYLIFLRKIDPKEGFDKAAKAILEIANIVLVRDEK